jgi:hypothetical protein
MEENSIKGEATTMRFREQWKGDCKGCFMAEGKIKISIFTFTDLSIWVVKLIRRRSKKFHVQVIETKLTMGEEFRWQASSGFWWGISSSRMRG